MAKHPVTQRAEQVLSWLRRDDGDSPPATTDRELMIIDSLMIKAYRLGVGRGGDALSVKLRALLGIT